MNKIKVWILALLLVFAFAVPAHAEYQDMWASVYKNTGKLKADGAYELEKVTTGVTYKVLAVDSNTAETLYAYGDPLLTSKTNPITTTVFATDGKIAFRVDPTDSTNDRYVDLLVTLSNGYSAVVKDFDRYQHSIVIDARPNTLHHGLIWFSGSTTNQTVTGVTFGAYTNISKVGLEVITALSGQTISIGTGAAATGFINKELLTNTGFITTSGASTGSLLGSGSAYQWYNQGYTITSSTSLTYSVSSTTGTPAGYIHYWFTEVR